MLCEPRDGALQPRVSPTFSTLSGSGSFKIAEESIITLPFISPLVKSLPFNDHTTLEGHWGNPVRKQHPKQIIGALSGAGYGPLLIILSPLALLGHCWPCTSPTVQRRQYRIQQ